MTRETGPSSGDVATRSLYGLWPVNFDVWRRTKSRAFSGRWLCGFDLVRYTTATEDEQQICADRIGVSPVSNAAHSERADGEIIPSTTPVQANENSTIDFSISQAHREDL